MRQHYVYRLVDENDEFAPFAGVDPDFDGPPPMVAPLTHAEREGYAFGAEFVPHPDHEPPLPALPMIVMRRREPVRRSAPVKTKMPRWLQGKEPAELLRLREAIDQQLSDWKGKDHVEAVGTTVR